MDQPSNCECKPLRLVHVGSPRIVYINFCGDRPLQDGESRTGKSACLVEQPPERFLADTGLDESGPFTEAGHRQLECLAEPKKGCVRSHELWVVPSTT